jgi:4,5-dihydroxyphthalate decarboxylase
LFENPGTLERAYYARTRIFPIMHTVVIRRSLYEENRWIARALYDAFKSAKKLLNDFYLAQEAQLHRFLMIPWLAEHVGENRRLLGNDPWPYGISKNRETLQAFVRHHHEQGLSDRAYAIEELFASETLDD